METDTLINTSEFICRAYKGMKRYKLTDKQLKEINSVRQLLIEIMIMHTSTLTNKGLNSAYIERRNVELAVPKGNINISETIRRRSQMRGKVICTYQEYTRDTDINRYLKALFNKIVMSDEINQGQYVKIVTLLQNFNAVSNIDIKQVKKWNKRYDNSTIRYKPIIWIGEMITSKNNSEQEILYSIYCNQLYNYMRSTVEEYGLKVEHINLNIDREAEENIDASGYGKSALIIRNTERAVIIRTEFKGEQEADKELVRYRKLAHDISEYKREYVVDAIGITLSLNCDDRYMIIEENEASSVDGETIIKIILNINDPLRIMDGKVKKEIIEYIESR